MFVRNQAQPVVWNGTQYRSALEVNVAKELDRLGVKSRYEKIPVRDLHYLPDFKIDHLPDADMGPASWIEVKPPQAIYAVRDHFNLPERFEDAEAFEMTRDDLAEVCPELMKPKGLAELTGEPVLVASAINRNETVALVMYADFVEVTRSHPLVCWKNVLKERERAEWCARREAQRREYEAMQARRQVEWERQAVERNAERRRVGESNLGAFRRSDYSAAKYPGTCVVCFDYMPAERLYKAHFGAEGWKVCCKHHLGAA